MKMEYAERARALVGTRFRPQGRSRDGLDCIGVVLLTFGFDAGAIRKDYRLRGDYRSELEQGLLVQFRRLALRQLGPGDVMLICIAGDQLHLGVRTDRGFVHAHAGIGFVVETPGAPEWLVLSGYRKRTRIRGS